VKDAKEMPNGKGGYSYREPDVNAEFWPRWQEGLEVIFSSTQAGRARTQEVACLLQHLTLAHLAACRIEAPDGPELGLAGPGDTALWMSFMAGLDPQGEQLPNSPEAGVKVQHQKVVHRGQVLGMLVVGFTALRSVKARRGLNLAPAAAELALWLRLEACEKAPAPAVVHDLANHLNSMVLQASCLLLKVEENVKPDIERIRREGIHAAGLLRSLRGDSSQADSNEGRIS
jgi:hypothetical protein